jgi:hypothetical protein
MVFRLFLEVVIVVFILKTFLLKNTYLGIKLTQIAIYYTLIFGKDEEKFVFFINHFFSSFYRTFLSNVNFINLFGISTK